MTTLRVGKPLIGLLGGVGAGKSTVARHFASLGCGVIDADALSREAIQDPQVRAQLREWWGPSVMAADGGVDRRAVGQIVFQDPRERRRLEGLLHPRVRAARRTLRAQMQADPSIRAIVEDSPLLLEAGLDRECDVLVFVDASREHRLQRVRARGWTEAELGQREKNQVALDIKAAKADYVVDNNAGAADCLVHVHRVLSQILHEPA